MRMLSALARIIRKLVIRLLSNRISKIHAYPILNQLVNQANESDLTLLKPDYLSYVNTVSNAEMAASFECMTLLYNLSRGSSFKKVADFGSGFSSYVLRKYAASTRDVKVISVDDNEYWVEKTRSYLIEKGVDTEGVMSMETFITGGESDFDMIFLDLNFVDVRKDFIQLTIDRCKIGGLIVFDDVHKEEYLFEVLKQTLSAHVKLIDVRAFTLDRFGRFAILALKTA